MVSYNNHVTIHTITRKLHKLKQIHYYWVLGHIEDIRYTLQLWLRSMRKRHQTLHRYCCCCFKWYEGYLGMACISKPKVIYVWVSDCPLSGALSTHQAEPSWLEYWLLSGLWTLYILSRIDHVVEILLIPDVPTMVQIWIGIPRPAINHTDGTRLNQ